MKRLLNSVLATGLASAAASVGLPTSSIALAQQLDRSSLGVVAGSHQPRFSTATVGPGRRFVADAAGTDCSANRIGEIRVATLQNRPIVILFANGKPVTLLLDTGAASTILTPDAAHRIGAQPPRIDFPRQMGGVGGGTFGTNEVELRSFSIGGVAISWRRVLVAPIKMSSSLGTLDGVLGTDVLGDFDIDLDLPHYRMVFYTKQSAPDAAPNWSEPYARIAASRSLSDHLFFPVRLDGRRIDALFDTGSQLSVLSSATALALGVSKAALAKDRPMITQGAAAERLSSHLHQFSQLEIGDEVVHHPEFVVTDIKLSDADLVLGINFLITRRVWFSYGSKQVFLSHRN
jgi:predicted aspartyl protease